MKRIDKQEKMMSIKLAKTKREGSKAGLMSVVYSSLDCRV